MPVPSSRPLLPLVALRRPTRRSLRSLRQRLETASPTYDPAALGYRSVSRTCVLGSDGDTFARARSVLREWRMHRGAGLFMDVRELAHGADVVQAVRMGPVLVFAPCRVVTVTDDARRYGFAYATLPGHPEQGIEWFLVRQGGDGEVRLTIEASSRAGTLLTRLAGPIGHWQQRRITDAYVAAMVREVARGG